MAYIGNQPALGNFVKLDAITTSATDTYNLLNGGVAFSPGSANQCIVSLNGVIQEPTSTGNVGGFTISGSTIVFTSALTSVDVIDFILVLGSVLNLGTPSDGTVTTAKLAGGLTVTHAVGAVGTPSITFDSDSNTGIFSPTADTIAFTEGGTEAMRINSDGNVALAKNIGLGGATPTTSGTGITFPASASASTDGNTLDDYEEGTWTPVLTFGGGSTGITYQGFNGVGYYQKIGYIVFFSCTQYLSSKGSSSGSALVGGLPFTSGRGNDGRTALSVNLANTTFTGQFQVQMDFNSTEFIFANTTEAGTNTAMTNSNFTNTTTFNVAGFYAVS